LTVEPHQSVVAAAQLTAFIEAHRHGETWGYTLTMSIPQRELASDSA
jgi:hypothetical protein